MNLKNIAAGIKDRETAAFGYKGKVAIREIFQEPCFSGCMDLLTTAKIKLGYNPEYAEESQALEVIVEKPFDNAFSSLTRHELNHKGGGNFRGCPRNIDLHAEKILEPVAETLSRLGFQDVPVNESQGLYAYFANMIEDVVDNSELGTKSDHTGMFLLYKDNAEHLDSKKFTLLFDAFVELQERLYAGRRAKKLIKPHHSEAQKVKEAVDNFMEKSGLDNFKTKVTTRRKKREVEIFDRKTAARYCLDENNWASLSKTLTEEFAKLIDKSKMAQMIYIKKMFLPLKGESDSFGEEMNDPEVKMKFAFRKYQQPGSSFAPPAYMQSFEALDLVYQRLARNLEIKTTASTRSEAMPVMWYGKKPFDAKNDRLSRARIGINHDARLELKVKKYHEDDQVEFTESKTDIPEIRFVLLDTSSSMQESAGSNNTGKVMNPWAEEKMQWGDNSKYHHALLGWYGLVEYLKKQGALKHTSVKFANYSSVTCTADNLTDSKKLALSPQFGGTRLDLSKVKRLFGNKQLIFSLSDGAVDNWNAIKAEYIRRAKQNEYFHLQIGQFTRDAKGNITNKPAMAQDLEDAGLPVIYDDGRSVGKMIIDLTKPYVIRSKK